MIIRIVPSFYYCAQKSLNSSGNKSSSECSIGGSSYLSKLLSSPSPSVLGTKGGSNYKNKRVNVTTCNNPNFSKLRIIIRSFSFQDPLGCFILQKSCSKDHTERIFLYWIYKITFSKMIFLAVKIHKKLTIIILISYYNRIYQNTETTDYTFVTMFQSQIFFLRCTVLHIFLKISYCLA